MSIMPALRRVEGNESTRARSRGSREQVERKQSKQEIRNFGGSLCTIGTTGPGKIRGKREREREHKKGRSVYREGESCSRKREEDNKTVNAAVPLTQDDGTWDSCK